MIWDNIFYVLNRRHFGKTQLSIHEPLARLGQVRLSHKNGDFGYARATRDPSTRVFNI